MDDLNLAIQIAQLTIDSINKQLDESKHKNDCLRHTLSRNYKIELEEEKRKNKKVLKAKFETLPGKALYQGAVEVKNLNYYSIDQPLILDQTRRFNFTYTH